MSILQDCMACRQPVGQQEWQDCRDGTTASCTRGYKLANIHSGLHLHACACAYSAIYAWKLWAETLLSPQSGKVPRHVEAELPLPAHPITLRLQAGAGAVLGICRFAIAGSINASHHRDMKHVVIGRAAVAVTTRTR